MKTIVFLALLSLSFAFIPKSLYKENSSVSDVVTRNASDFVKDTNSSDSSDYLVIEIYPGDDNWNNTSFYNRSNLTGSDLESTNNVSLSHPSDDIVIESYFVEYNWTNITTNSSDSSDYLLIEIDFVDSDWNNITDSTNSSDYLDNTTFYERYNQIIADVIAGIAHNAAKNMNLSDSSDETVMETYFGESNWTNITNSSDFSDYPVIEIDTDDSDWINIKPEIIELLKPIFMNFTEAYYEYLSENDSDVSLEDQLLYDDILTSIAQLFNETIEEKALFGNTTEKDGVIERNNTENQDGKNLIGSQ